MGLVVRPLLLHVTTAFRVGARILKGYRPGYLPGDRAYSTETQDHHNITEYARDPTRTAARGGVSKGHGISLFDGGRTGRLNISRKMSSEAVNGGQDHAGNSEEAFEEFCTKQEKKSGVLYKVAYIHTSGA